MKKSLEGGKFYVLRSSCDSDWSLDVDYLVLSRIVNIEIKYIKKGSFRTLEKFQTETFAEYKKINEPMLINNQYIEHFSNIPIITKYNTQDIYLLDNYLTNDKRPEAGYVLTVPHHEPPKSNDPNTYFRSGIYPYPIVPVYSPCAREISGTELKKLIISISDTPNALTIDRLTFNRHKNTLNNLFENACRIGGFPYKTVDEYHNFVARQNSIKQQQEIYAQRKNQQDDEEIKKLLNRYKR